MRTWVIALFMAGCGGPSLHLTLSAGRSPPREEVPASVETITQRFDAPIVSVAVGRAVTCVLLDATTSPASRAWTEHVVLVSQSAVTRKLSKCTSAFQSLNAK